MKLIFTWKDLIVLDDNKTIEKYPSTCVVRNEINGKRSTNQVIYTIPQSGKPKPYYPRTFPSGIHEITSIEWIKDLDRLELFGPVIIKTDATREVFSWDLTINGNYWIPTGKTQIDTGYYIHHTHRYKTTHGCIRGGDTEAQMIEIAKLVEPFLKDETVLLEVL